MQPLPNFTIDHGLKCQDFFLRVSYTIVSVTYKSIRSELRVRLSAQLKLTATKLEKEHCTIYKCNTHHVIGSRAQHLH